MQTQRYTIIIQESRTDFKTLELFRYKRVVVIDGTRIIYRQFGSRCNVTCCVFCLQISYIVRDDSFEDCNDGERNGHSRTTKRRLDPRTDLAGRVEDESHSKLLAAEHDTG